MKVSRRVAKGYEHDSARIESYHAVINEESLEELDCCTYNSPSNLKNFLGSIDEATIRSKKVSEMIAKDSKMIQKPVN